jgi:hypothetical protein
MRIRSMYKVRVGAMVAMVVGLALLARVASAKPQVQTIPTAPPPTQWTPTTAPTDVPADTPAATATYSQPTSGATATLDEMAGRTATGTASGSPGITSTLTRMPVTSTTTVQPATSTRIGGVRVTSTSTTQATETVEGAPAGGNEGLVAVGGALVLIIIGALAYTRLKKR